MPTHESRFLCCVCFSIGAELTMGRLPRSSSQDTYTIPHMTAAGVYPSDVRPLASCLWQHLTIVLLLSTWDHTTTPSTAGRSETDPSFVSFVWLSQTVWFKWMEKENTKKKLHKEKPTHQNEMFRLFFSKLLIVTGGHVWERRLNWCHSEGSSLKRMGAEGHPGITMHHRIE